MSDSPPEINIHALGTLLTNSYGKKAIALVNEDGPVFGVVRDALPEKVKKQWAGEVLELWAGLDEDENVFVCVFLDLETKDLDPQKLALALYEVSRGIGMCYGSLGSLDDKHVTFVVGLPGSSDDAVPGAILAETMAYALNVATTAKEHLDRIFAAKKRRRRG